MFASLRNLLALALVLPLTASAQFQSPANVAFLLYRSCVAAEFQVNDNVFETKTEQRQFMLYLDEKCTTWTIIWFPAFAGYPIDKMSTDRISRFIGMRQLLLEDVEKDAVVAPATKK